MSMHTRTRRIKSEIKKFTKTQSRAKLKKKRLVRFASCFLGKYRVLFEAMKKAIDIEINEKKPEGFAPQVQVAACYLEIDSKLLLLQRASNKLEYEIGNLGECSGKIWKEMEVLCLQ